jgi:hypothetical protein
VNGEWFPLAGVLGISRVAAVSYSAGSFWREAKPDVQQVAAAATRQTTTMRRLMLRLLPPYASVRYQDRYTERWIRFRSPESWRGRVRVRYRRVPFARLQPSGSQTHVEVKAYWRDMLARAEPIPPLVACATPGGKYYLYDGNHRYCALADYFGEYGSSLARVRTAIVEPLRGHHFAWRWFDGYGTYLLECSEDGAPQSSPPAAASPLMLGASQACSRGEGVAIASGPAGLPGELEGESESLASAAAAL